MNRLSIRGLVLAAAIGSLTSALAAIPGGSPGIAAAVLGLPLMAFGLWTGRPWFLLSGLGSILALRAFGELVSPSGAMALVAGLAAYVSAELARWSFAARGFTQFASSVVRRGFRDSGLVIVASAIAGTLGWFLASDRDWPVALLPIGASAGPIAIAILTVIVIRRADRAEASIAKLGD